MVHEIAAKYDENAFEEKIIFALMRSVSGVFQYIPKIEDVKLKIESLKSHPKAKRL